MGTPDGNFVLGVPINFLRIKFIGNGYLEL